MVRVVVVTWDIHKESGGELIMDTRGALKKHFQSLVPRTFLAGILKSFMQNKREVTIRAGTVVHVILFELYYIYESR